jgi:hypothetical protein
MARPPEELGFLLLAAYNFDDVEQFIEISARALRDLTLGFLWHGRAMTFWAFSPKISEVFESTGLQKANIKLMS